MDAIAAWAADQFWFLAHVDRDGAPQMSPNGLALGLAGCLIGELMLGGFLVVDGDQVIGNRRSSPPDELLQHEVYVTLGQRMPVRDALRAVALTAADRVAKRMERENLLTYVEEAKWHRLGTKGRWVPVNSLSAASAQAGLVYIGQRYPNVQCSWSDVLLAAIADATALVDRIYRNFPDAKDGLAQLMNQSTEPGPQITHLAQATSAALAAAAVTR